MSNQKGQTIIWIVIGVLLILGLLFFMFSGDMNIFVDVDEEVSPTPVVTATPTPTSTTTPTPTVTVSPTPTDEWRGSLDFGSSASYENESFGVSFQYPEGLDQRVTTESSTALEVRLEPTDEIDVPEDVNNVRIRVASAVAHGMIGYEQESEVERQQAGVTWEVTRWVGQESDSVAILATHNVPGEGMSHAIEAYGEAQYEGTLEDIFEEVFTSFSLEEN